MHQLLLPTLRRGLLALVALSLGGAAGAQVVLENDFEDGTTQGWLPRGSAVLENTAEAAQSGAYSLKTTGRTADWHGPSQNLLGLLERGALYQISGYVRLVEGQPASTVKMTIQRDPVGGDTQYDQVASSATDGVTDAEWVHLEGQYVFTDDVSGLTIYVESSNATSEYYLDDFTIVLLAPPLPGGPGSTVVEHDFEDGTTQGWGPRGPVILESSTDVAQSGARSLKTTGRTDSWNGPTLNLLGLLEKDGVYQFSGYVRLVAGHDPSTVKMTVQRDPVDDSTAYEQVASSATDGVTDAEWVYLEGEYSYSTEVTGLQVYVESSDPTSEYYLDDFEIVLLVPPPEGPPDQSGISNDFEDATEQGWGPRGSGVTVAATSDDAHGGSFSLLTTGRTAAWNGPSRDVFGKLHKGSKYRISVWVKLAPGEPDTVIRVSLQRDFLGGTNYETLIGNTTVTENEWVEFTTLYTRAFDADAISLYVESSEGLASFYIDDFELTHIPPVPIQTDIPSVHETLADYFPVGAAIEPSATSGLHAELLTRHFNSLTAENVMKPQSLQPSEGTFNFANADLLIEFARANDMLVRGHTLVWHQQTGAWMFQDADGNPLQPIPEHRELLLQRLENHIRTVVSRYKDDVYAWDVVNEPIDANQPDGLRRSPWYEIIGPEYIDIAFQIAREEAPDARLYLNEYSTTNSAKRAALYDVVSGLKARGVPIDGVGHQMHMNIESPPIAQIGATIELFADLGLDNQITELDMSLYTNSSDSYPDIPEELLVLQGHRYKELFKELRRLQGKVSNVTFWGLADDHTWLKTFPIARLDLPLLFDEDLQAKHAYWGVVDPSELPVLIQELDVHYGRPRIDGRNELEWAIVPPTALQSEVEGLGGSFKALWSEDHLSVLIDVTDPTRNREDLVEVFVDRGDGSDLGHYTFHRFRHHRMLPGWPWYKVTGTWTGYRVEARIPLRPPAEEGAQVRFDVRVRDGGEGTHVSWSDTTHGQEVDPSHLGILTLVQAVRYAEAVWGRAVIDGFFDPAWFRAPEITTETFVLGSGGSTARVRTMWDPGHLYFFAVVSDALLSVASPNPWEQDSIEVFIDQNNGKTTYYEDDDGQYRVNFENMRTFGGSASEDSIESAAVVVDGGYLIEGRISLNAIQPRPGTLIGFDVQVNNDETGDGTRASAATWSDTTGRAYLDTSTFGVLRLVMRARCR